MTSRNSDITFDQAFKAFRMHSALYKLRDGLAADHNCGWLVRPVAVELMNGESIRVCYGCGSCFREPDNDSALVAA